MQGIHLMGRLSQSVRRVCTDKKMAELYSLGGTISMSENNGRCSKPIHLATPLTNGPAIDSSQIGINTMQDVCDQLKSKNSTSPKVVFTGTDTLKELLQYAQNELNPNIGAPVFFVAAMHPSETPVIRNQLDFFLRELCSNPDVYNDYLGENKVWAIVPVYVENKCEVEIAEYVEKVSLFNPSKPDTCFTFKPSRPHVIEDNAVWVTPELADHDVFNHVLKQAITAAEPLPQPNVHIYGLGDGHIPSGNAEGILDEYLCKEWIRDSLGYGSAESRELLRTNYPNYFAMVKAKERGVSLTISTQIRDENGFFLHSKPTYAAGRAIQLLFKKY